MTRVMGLINLRATLCFLSVTTIGFRSISMLDRSQIEASAYSFYDKLKYCTEKTTPFVPDPAVHTYSVNQSCAVVRMGAYLQVRERSYIDLGEGQIESSSHCSGNTASVMVLYRCAVVHFLINREKVSHRLNIIIYAHLYPRADSTLIKQFRMKNGAAGQYRVNETAFESGEPSNKLVLIDLTIEAFRDHAQSPGESSGPRDVYDLEEDRPEGTYRAWINLGLAGIASTALAALYLVWLRKDTIIQYANTRCLSYWNWIMASCHWGGCALFGARGDDESLSYGVG